MLKVFVFGEDGFNFTESKLLELAEYCRTGVLPDNYVEETVE